MKGPCSSNWGPCTKLYCLSLVFWYKGKRCGPCTHERPLHLFLWPLLISRWPLHPFLSTGFMSLAHGPCTSSRGPCTGLCPEKMLLFSRLIGSSYLVLRIGAFLENSSQSEQLSEIKPPLRRRCVPHDQRILFHTQWLRINFCELRPIRFNIMFPQGQWIGLRI